MPNVQGDRKQIPASVRLSHPSRNYDDTPIVRLSVTDSASHVRVVEIELDAEQFLSLMRGTEAKASATWTKGLDSIGKEMQHESKVLPGTLYGNQMAADHHCAIWAAAHGWTSWTAKRNNASNWVFTGRRWVDPE